MSELTLKEVASGADTSISYLSKVETGALEPTVAYVAKVLAFISDSMIASEAGKDGTLAAEGRRSA